jgi:hypothetical protein
MEFIRSLTNLIARLRSFWTFRKEVVQVPDELELTLKFRVNGEFLHATVNRTKSRERLPGDSNWRRLAFPSNPNQLRQLEELCAGNGFEIDLLGEKWRMNDQQDIVTVRYETDGFSMRRSECLHLIQLVKLASAKGKDKN